MRELMTRLTALITLTITPLALLPLPAEAQVRTPPAQKVCRELEASDPYFSQYSSCCDIEGGKSRWRKRSDGKDVDLISMCATWGIMPSATAAPVTPPPRANASAAGIRTGRYNCPLNGIPVDVTLTKNGYRIASGGDGRIAFSARETDNVNGSYAKYAITGGPFDGFFFRHLDNGEVHLGRFGWTRCEPR